MQILEKYRFSIVHLLSKKHLQPLEELLQEACEAFSQVPRTGERRPLILIGGEFYGRLDDRCNRDIIRKIEKEGGEVSLAPASELFSYTALINYLEACTAFKLNKNLSRYLQKVGLGFALHLAHREEKLLSEAARELLAHLKEPSPQEIRHYSRKYVSDHYGGEPPMTIGRVCALARQTDVDGAVFVAPFTCMPGSVVESQMGPLREELDFPMVAVYYDGKENANREEFIRSLVFQAKQRLLQRAGAK